MAYGGSVYGEGVYGEDEAVAPLEPIDFILPGSHADCVCGDGWRFEATDLATGRVKAVLHPISADWEDPYSRVGTGSLLIATRDPAAMDIWPHETGVYISRVNPDGTREAHFGGLIEKFSGSQGGATTLGLQSIEEYLFHRLIADDDEGLEYETPGYVSPTTPGPGLQQTKIATDLVNLIHLTPKAIPLFPVAETSSQIRVRHWDYWEFKNIGEAIKELTEVINGVKYKLEHVFVDGYWSTNMRFSDTLGVTRDYTIKSDREGWQYSLEIDAKDQASRVYVIGEGEEAAQKLAIAYDADTLLPEFHASPAFKDVSVQATLDEYARGHVANFRDPIATPTMTIAGLGWPEPDVLQTGDIVNVDIGFGVITFQGQCRVLSQSYRLQTEGQPVTRTLALLPIIRPKDSIRTQIPARPPSPGGPIGQTGPVTTIPWPTPGKVTTIGASHLAEVSGMQYSRKYPGHVWVHNDETKTPSEPGQVYLISLADGKKKASYVTSPALPAGADPEAIRIHPDGSLWLADIGNGGTSSERALYRTPEPVVGSGVVAGTTKYVITIPGSPDAECLLIHPSTGEVIIVTKEASGKAYTYGTTVTNNEAGVLKASGMPANVSDGTFTLDGKFILFTTAGQNYVNVYSASTWKKVGQINIPAMPKCEAITMEGRCSFLVTSEGLNQPIYRVLLPNTYGAPCASTPPSGGGTTPPTTAVVPAQVLNLTNWKLTLPV